MIFVHAKEDCIRNKAVSLIGPGNNGRHTITEELGGTLAIRFQTGEAKTFKALGGVMYF